MFKVNNPITLVYFQLMIAEFLFLLKAPRREHFYLRLLAALGASVVIGQIHYIVTWSGVSPMLLFLTAWLLAAGSALLCWKVDFKTTMFVASGSYAVQHMGYSVTLALEWLIQGVWGVRIFNQITAWGGFAIAMIAIYALVFRKNEEFYNSADMRQLLISTLLILVCIVLSSVRRTCQKDLPYIIVYDFIACLCCLLIQFSISAGERMSEEKRTLELIINQQHEQHELSKQAVEMMGVKLHDIRSQIRHIQEEMNAEDSHKLDGLKRTVQIYSSMANTGNATVDAILMEKGLMCEINGIRFSYIVDGAQLAFMEAVDIFSLLNNMLDNAIESELKVTQKDSRMMSLRVVRAGEMVLVNAENYCDYPVDYEHLTTTKQDKANHGIGMKGIQYVVDKYDGDMRISLEDSMFHVSIVFPVKA